MKKFLPVTELARDDRFTWVSEGERFKDPRTGNQGTGSFGRAPKMTSQSDDAPERSRSLMHGIFMGEIQALEAAGRTAWDFREDEGTPYHLRLDMARQCWDEARHVEISVKLMQHMGTEIGEFTESTFLYEAGCNPDPVLRLCGVNRALEGL